MAEEAYNATIDDLDALEQAIVEICDIETVHAIRERKRRIQQK